MNRKRIVYALLSIMLLNLAASATAAARPVDVPVDHWAYLAVSTVLSRDLMSVFEDGSFKGSEPADRYTLANALYLLLEQIKAAQKSEESSVLSQITDLSTSFEKDLGQWYADREALQGELILIQEQAVALEERLSRVIEAQQESSSEQDLQIKELQTQLAALDFNISEILDVLGAIDVQVRDHGDSLVDKDELLNNLVDALITLDNQLFDQEIALEDLELRLGNLAAEKTLGFAQLEDTDAELAEQIAALENLNKQLEADLRSVAGLLRQESQKRDDLSSDLSARLASMEASISELREDKSVLEEVRQTVSGDIQAQINASLIREQRLERQIKELQEEFEAYKESSETELKSAKTMTMIALALAAIGAVVGVIGMGN
ncbi:MAG: hypothetical protein GX101_03980 [Firmicutes bacterium]|mgnify:CR=1 FL=1|jgi:DNA repair exonuclease SbcCD ATPase subunit|nr:hypothetical protein [Bacillota bacterium]NLO65830.1 hypothetical protein [Bacillota bacterium]